MPKISPNSVSLAGEFAVLSQLALRGYDANMTLGRTKGVDILVSDPDSRRMWKIEVKTNYRKSREKPTGSRVFGRILSSWIMVKKHDRQDQQHRVESRTSASLRSVKSAGDCGHHEPSARP
jgi:hypothetical protein